MKHNPEDFVEHTVTPLELSDVFAADQAQRQALHAAGTSDSKGGFMRAVGAEIQTMIDRKDIPSGPTVPVLGIRLG